MRIRLIIPQSTHRDYINRGLYYILHSRLSNFDGAEIVDASPEIVHIFGTWSNASAKETEKYRKQHLPVVFTSIKGMIGLKLSDGTTTDNIALKLAIKRIARCGAVIHVCGQQENASIKEIAKYAETRVIANPSFTATTDTQSIVSNFFDLYTYAYKTNDNEIREHIKKQVNKISGIKYSTANFCERIMYIRHRYLMGNIPQFYIDETSETMLNSDYEEKEIEQTLEALKVANFAAYTMTLLEHKAKLTEGFMPIRQKEGKIVEKMENIITQ